LEVAPPAASKADTGEQRTRQERPAALKPTPLREIEQALHWKQERIHRLTAY
jgi:hypothetical protein